MTLSIIKMANQPQIEQCLVALTELLLRQNQPVSIRVAVEKRVKRIQSFKGEPGTLASFTSTVDRILEEFGEQAGIAYEVNLNEKIIGDAKNILLWKYCNRGNNVSRNYVSITDRRRIR